MQAVAAALSHMCNSVNESGKIMLGTLLRVAVVASLIASPALAQRGGKQAPRPAQLRGLLDCRRIVDSAARLACFDRSAAAIDTAEATGELVIADREQLRSARRSLFGLTLPRIALLDGGRPEEAAQEFESKIRSAKMASDGKWTFQLDEAVWRATEASPYQADPRAGETVKIRRGPLGSYDLSVEGRSALRAVRVR